MHLSCDRGRQRSVRPVRLPQPMGAGGQQPLRSHPGVDRMLRRCGRAKALTVKSVLPERRIFSARTEEPLREPIPSERCPGRAKSALGGSPQPKG
jgi:hypothetical protein